jgi:hypothetical protein
MIYRQKIHSIVLQNYRKKLYITTFFCKKIIIYYEKNDCFNKL